MIKFNEKTIEYNVIPGYQPFNTPISYKETATKQSLTIHVKLNSIDPNALYYMGFSVLEDESCKNLISWNDLDPKSGEAVIHSLNSPNFTNTEIGFNVENGFNICLRKQTFLTKVEVF